MQSGFWIIPKITFANLWKPIYDTIIIPASSDILNLETVERKGKINKNWIFWKLKEHFR